MNMYILSYILENLLITPEFFFIIPNAPNFSLPPGIAQVADAIDKIRYLSMQLLEIGLTKVIWRNKEKLLGI